MFNKQCNKIVVCLAGRFYSDFLAALPLRTINPKDRHRSLLRETIQLSVYCKCEEPALSKFIAALMPFKNFTDLRLIHTGIQTVFSCVGVHWYGAGSKPSYT